MFGSFKSFTKNRSGAFAMQFALMVVPLMGATGLAIDGGRAFLARYELSAALDAAALAVGSSTGTTEQLEAIAQRFVDKNFRSMPPGTVEVELDPQSDVITINGVVAINTFFMPVMGIDTVTVSAASEVRRGGSNLEVALALDITDSMDGDPFESLQVAASNLINRVVQDGQEDSAYFSRAAIAPWANVVYAGDMADEIRGAVKGPANITAATWRDGSAQTIAAGTGWRVGGAGKTISGAAWKNGASRTISNITKVSSNTRIQVTTSANHGYANGEFVRITGANGSYTGLNNNIYCVADKANTTFNLKTIGCSTYAPPPGGTSQANQGTSQRCYDNDCDVRITTDAAHGFAAGDRVRITGVSGSGSTTMGSLNNGTDQSWVVEEAPSTTTFTVESHTGPNVTSDYSSSSSDEASECYTSDCKFRVITSANHGFSTNDRIYITGATVSGSGTSMNNSAGSTWQIANAAGTTFYLPNSGYSYRDWSSAGTASKCFTSACEVRVTAAGHHLSNNDITRISGVGGMTQINKTGTDAWSVKSVSGDDFILTSSVGPNYGTYTTNTGAVQCLMYGCQYMRYTNKNSSLVVQQVSNCITERTGAQAYTDASPASAPAGFYYPGTGIYAVCRSEGPLTGLTSDKDELLGVIDDMVVTGSTAGQIGTAWAWYMLSPNWNIWSEDDTHFNPSDPDDTEDLVKVAVLMTDGEFNTAHCNGVTSSNYGYNSNNERINCNSTNGAPFTQATTICANMRAAGIVVYTVGFDLAEGGAAETFMEGCASAEENSFLASSTEELEAAFDAIATSISKLRIAR